MSSEGPLHQASQLGQGGGRDSNTYTSHRDHGDRVGAGLHDGSTIKDGSSIKVQIVDRDTSSPLKTELMSGSHGMSNSSIMKASLLRDLGEHVRRACDFLTISGDS